MRKLAAPFVMLGLAVVLMGAGTGASAPSRGAALPPDASPSAPAGTALEATFGPDGVVNVSGILLGDAATPTPIESVAGDTSAPGESGTPPPTSSAMGIGGIAGSSPMLAGLLSLMLAFLVGLFVQRQRRRIGRGVPPGANAVGRRAG